MPAVQRMTVRQLINEGAILAVQDGNHGELHPTQENYVPEGIPFIMASDLKGNDLDLITCKFLSEGLASTLRKGFALPGDVLLTHKGTLGLTTVVPELDAPYIMLTPQVTYYRVNPDALRPEYLHYVFSSTEFQKRLLCHVREGTRPYVGITAQLNLEIEYPDIDVQTAIVEQLIALDRLIQISHQSIKYLEEAARLIYTEWFVRLRFPGHENTPKLDGVPIGWTKSVTSEFIDVLSGGTPHTKTGQYWDGEIPFFTPADAPDCVYVTDTEKHISEDGLNACNSQLFPKNIVFISARGTVGKIVLAQQPMAMNQSCYALRTKDGSSQLFLLCAMQAITEHFKQAASGGVFDTIVVDTFRRMPITWPSRKVIDQFDKAVAPIFGQIEALLLQIAQLRQARDLLLPRLISGQLRL